jgi:protein phosphatase
MAKYGTSAAVICHMGCVRDNNEDNFFFNGTYLPLGKMDKGDHLLANFAQRVQLFAVCDGMGGEDSGERASFLAASALRTVLPKIRLRKNIPEALYHYANHATRLVFRDSVKRRNQRQGSTLAVLALWGYRAYIGNIGDSRVYILRKNQFRQISFDHTDVGRLYRMGRLTAEEARKHPKGNVILQYIGMDVHALPAEFISLYTLPVFRGDRFLLCSDGLSDLIPVGTIHSILEESATPDDAAIRLTTAALELGGKDNITSMVLDIIGGNAVAPEMDDPLFSLQEDPNTLEIMVKYV